MPQTNVRVATPSAIHTNDIQYNHEKLNSEYFGNNKNYVHYYVGNEIISYDKRKFSSLEIHLGALISRFERFLRGQG